MANIKKGDTVKVINGKDRGKSGKVIKVDAKKKKLTVEGLNVFKKHVRPRQQGEKGEVVQVTRPMAIAKVMLMCPACGKAARVGFRASDGVKSRICRKCKAVI